MKLPTPPNYLYLLLILGFSIQAVHSLFPYFISDTSLFIPKIDFLLLPTFHLGIQASLFSIVFEVLFNQNSALLQNREA